MFTVHSLFAGTVLDVRNTTGNKTGKRSSKRTARGIYQKEYKWPTGT
jgi:hypothetical protein